MCLAALFSVRRRNIMMVFACLCVERVALASGRLPTGCKLGCLTLRAMEWKLKAIVEERSSAPQGESDRVRSV